MTYWTPLGSHTSVKNLMPNWIRLAGVVLLSSALVFQLERYAVTGTLSVGPFFVLLGASPLVEAWYTRKVYTGLWPKLYLLVPFSFILFGVYRMFMKP